MSNIELFYNSDSNSVYDDQPPVITITGSNNINHEINSGAYNDAGATCVDDPGTVDLTGSIVVGGDTVDVTTLGVYNITYDCTDAKGNVATQKIRTVNVIDTTNPVVTLNGSASVSVNQYDTYNELGATASDNSNESLTVVIGGSVDTNVAGDYVLTYTATDSSGNSHQISRIVSVVGAPPTLQWSNPSTDIIASLINFSAYTTNKPSNTRDTFTISNGSPSWKNGDYAVECVNYQRQANKHAVHMLDGNTNVNKYFSANVVDHHYWGNYNFTHHDYGTVTMITNSYRDTGSGYKYYGMDTVEHGLLFYSTTASNSITYNGEYFQLEFPFLIELSKVGLYSLFTVGAQYMAEEVIVLGSSNNETTWDYIMTMDRANSTISGSVVTLEKTHTTTSKYNIFRFVITKGTNSPPDSYGNIDRNYLFTGFKMYGDIYTT